MACLQTRRKRLYHYHQRLGQAYLDGIGITNNSGITQNFATDPDNEGGFTFSNSASAGSSTTFTLNSVVGGGFGGLVDFFNVSSAVARL
jgi:hypothetical protein